MRSLVELKLIAAFALNCALFQSVATQQPAGTQIIDHGLQSKVVFFTLEGDDNTPVEPDFSGPKPPCCLVNNCRPGDPQCGPPLPQCCRKGNCPDGRRCPPKPPRQGCQNIGIFVAPEKGRTFEFEIDKAAIEFYSTRTDRLVFSVGADRIGCGRGLNPNTKSTGCMLTLNESSAAEASRYCNDQYYIRVGITGTNIPKVVYLVDAKAGKPAR